MNQLIKKVTLMIGGILCLIVFILNIFSVTTIVNNLSEKVTTRICNPLEIIVTTIIIFTIIITVKTIMKKPRDKKTKIIIIVSVLILYVILQILWIHLRQAIPIFDQQNVYEAAVKIHGNKIEALKNSQYLELYPQQLTLATIYVGIFKIVNSTNLITLQYLNVIANTMTIIGLLLITKQIGKEYKVSKVKTLTISLLFIALPLLSTFIYGDLLSLPMSIFSIYFIIKYSEKNKNRYAILSAIFMAMAYMLRMNNLIYIIALVIYILLDILKMQSKNIKNIIQKGIILILFIVISILPAKLIKTYWQNKLEIDNTKSFPTIGFICIGMEGGDRASGWYNGHANWAFEDIETSKQRYKDEVSNRIQYFVQNPVYFVKFYTLKIASMWTENTYAGLWYNQTYNFGQIEGIERTSSQQKLAWGVDSVVRKLTIPLYILQKAVVLIIFGITILVIMKHRKNISNEVLLLIIIFIGGFLFHILWEAKSRYIIPYIITLIPLASIEVEDYVMEKIKRIKFKNKKNGEKV